MLLPLSLLLVLFLAIPSSALTSEEEKSCYADEKNPYLYFGSKTAYQYIYNRHPRPIPYCKPVQVWMLARHGTRYPDSSEITGLMKTISLQTEVIKNLEAQDVKERRLCEKDINNLKAWTFNLTTNLDDHLTSQGHDELVLLAQRMKSNFPILGETADLPENETLKYLSFQTADTPRAQESVRAFLEGFYGNKMSAAKMPAPSADVDSLVMPYDKCKSWHDIVHSKQNRREITMFEDGHFMKDMVARVSTRLGFSYNLSLDAVATIYEMCRYEKAWYFQATSVWCAAFSKEDIMVFEYREDLSNYYIDFYGNALNQRLGCPLIRDLFARFKKTASLKNATIAEVGSVGTFYFSQRTMFMLFLGGMDIAHDKYPLTHDNYPTQNERLLRTSLIATFATNLAAVFYKCSQGEENQVAFYLNEHIVNYPGCNAGLCSLDFLLNKFRHVLEPAACNNDFCNRSSSTSLDASSLLLCSTALLALLYTSIV